MLVFLLQVFFFSSKRRDTGVPRGWSSSVWLCESGSLEVAEAEAVAAGPPSLAGLVRRREEGRVGKGCRFGGWPIT